MQNKEKIILIKQFAIDVPDKSFSGPFNQLNCNNKIIETIMKNFYPKQYEEDLKKR